MNATLIARIRAYTEAGRTAAMLRTLDEIQNLPETQPEADVASEASE